MTATRYRPAAESATRIVNDVLVNRGLEPVIQKTRLTETQQGDAWAFVILDVRRMARMEPYISDDLLHQIQTRLRGHAVTISNHTGLRYAIRLSAPRKLPRRVDFPGIQGGMIRIGVQRNGELAVPTGDLGHILVAGMTGSGKSVFLRLLAYQFIAEGALLAVSDLDGATLPMLEGNPNLWQPIAHSPDHALNLVRLALGECDHRAMLYSQTVGFPEKLEQYNEQIVREGKPTLPRLVLILDEYSATVTALGGPNGEFANLVAQLAWRGRKFGVSLILAAQDFSKSVIGRVRDQIGSTFCFRVRSEETARALGLLAATRIPEERPGLAVTERWGAVQTYLIPKELIQPASSALDLHERTLLLRAKSETDGRLSIPILTGWGERERTARKLLEIWEMRGWVLRDPQRDNARYITPKLAEILSNRQTGQTPSNLAE